jgi:predicted ATPase
MVEGAEEGRRASVRVNMYYAAYLAEAYRKTGHPTEGLKIVTKALVSAQQQAAFRNYGAELYRIQGELLLSQTISNGEQAETCFKGALDISRREHAKSLELRAAMSLSRLWQSQGKKAQAQQLLAEIYGWFTEGFDTADLKAAKELLEELS